MHIARPLLALALLAAPAALAQTPAPAATQGPAAAIPPTDANATRGLERVERHIADLQKRLAITPAQQPQWTAFADAMRQNARRMQGIYADRQARAASMTAIDDLKAYAAAERARAEDVERLLPPFEALYRAMTPEQRIGADKTFHDFQRGGARGRGRA